jgi:hypothetical protein
MDVCPAREALPRALVISAAATHAPRASFQILLNDLFMCFELVATAGMDRSKEQLLSADGQLLVDHSGATGAIVYRNVGMYAVIYIPDAPQQG